ncbi:transmembrane protein 256 homolog [Contarinia nasturtii]|uniref:transmembrane protein 256 homolog n=1 Tax=Contarinia nasturtii TaxID=265458 RepID=UPI0012D42F9D|nr:transmembrane protein 256 homolog [Contarinia nasturtii]
MVSFTDALNYVAYKNPVSQFTIAGVTQLAKVSGLHTKPSHARSVATKSVSDAVPISRQLGSSYYLIRVAALSGATAVCLAAYGRHSLKERSSERAETKEYRHIYESANHMHFIHSVVLLATPLTKRPLITGTLFISGMLLFSGTCYYKAIKKAKGENVEYIPAHLAPCGGLCLILGWLSMLF